MHESTTHSSGQQRPYSPTTGCQLRYLLYLPPEFDRRPDHRWPVLCFLHGRGEAARDVEGVEQPIELLFNHGAPPWHCAMNSPLVHDFIVVSPQLPEQRPWTPDDLQALADILETVYADLHGDRRRTFLTGFSLGGRGTFDFAEWELQRPLKSGVERLHWAALWPVDDAVQSARTTCSVSRVWLHYGSWHPEVQQDSARNLALQPVLPFRDADRSGDRLYTDYAAFGYGHCPTCVAAYADARVYRWLLHPEGSTQTKL